MTMGLAHTFRFRLVGFNNDYLGTTGWSHCSRQSVHKTVAVRQMKAYGSELVSVPRKMGGDGEEGEE